MLKNKEKNELRRIALSSNINKYIIGKDSIKGSILEMLENALNKNELIKISFLKTVEGPIDELINEIVDALKAEVVHKIGRTVILYRYSVNVKNHVLNGK